MNPIILKRFEDYLNGHSFNKETIIDYLRCISKLEDPPNLDDPLVVFNYVSQITQQKKENISRSGFITLRASLRSLFQMITGIRFRDFLKQTNETDKYDPLLTRYAEYCLNFLHITTTVTEAAIREVRLFLEKNVSNPDDIEWKTITAKDIISFLSKERSTLSIGSIGVSVTAIRRFFRFLMHNDYDIHLSVLDLPLSVPNWSKNSSLPIILSHEDRKKLDDYCFPNTAVGSRDRLILLLFSELGLRCNEVANICLSDIKWNHGTIVIRKTKTHVERELPVSSKLGTALENYVIHYRPKDLEDILLFKSKNRTNEPATVENIRGAIRRLYEKNGIVGWHVGTHALRRTVGSQLYKVGNDLKTVADFLGHESVSATKAYVRTDMESLKKVASSWPRRDSK